MIKHFCDVCGEEVTRNFVSERIVGRGYVDGNNPHLVTIIAGSATAWNQGDLCKECFRAVVLDAIDSEVSDRTAPEVKP